MRSVVAVVVGSWLLGVGCGRLGYEPGDAASAGETDAWGLDVGPPIDATFDAPGLDAPSIDAALDAPMPDAPMPDAPMPDAPMPDAVPPDAAQPDAGAPLLTDAAVLPGDVDPRCFTIAGDRYDEAGNGSPGDPYLICTGTQLQSFLDDGPDSFAYVLGDDIVLDTWNTRPSFLGTLDGNGHEVRLMTFAIDPMFGDLSGTVRHLRMRTSIDSSFRDRVGALAGSASGQITDVHLVTDFVSGQDETGGLVGQCNACRISDVSIVVARISGRATVGGVVGNMFAGTVDRARVRVTQIDARVTTGCSRLGGVVGYAHDGATVDEAFADVGIVLSTGGAGGVVGELALGSSARDVAATGRVVIAGGDCPVGAGGLVGDLGGSLQRGWANLRNPTAGIVDRVSLGATVRDVAGLTTGLGSPERVLRSCTIGSTITNTAVLDDGTPATGTLVCAFMAPRTSTDPLYFNDASNAPMSSWDSTLWSFAPERLPMLARIPP
ncbi:MAG: hypothetical protein J0L92_32125 [Deltaproteobacteria bacterium]|nr:hypothetical protein [Deltaproteobacteria bacterium]